ncbi:thiolase-like protein [Staphylotrichum tortipilum]|uniref:Fatty acid synthase subunit alpha n=1 Tax=Staphylotrichum tortipilum TaxID=2831512 RepID=A0AAN6MJ18_9PEZI|nr:thiolase-like protein [Staphylotrichum longicolle]
MIRHEMDEKQIAHQLLIELLVHQFAFPVKWTDTQDALLNGPDGVSRLVELGPSRVLANLAHKTLQRKLASGERPADASVEILASTTDTKALLFEYDPPELVEETPATAPSLPVVKESVAEPAPSLQAAPRLPSTPTARVPSVEDSPLSGIDVVHILVARKLKRSLAEVQTSKSIKDLCGGKSTLQNELVGELHNEFTSLPDRPEDVPLRDLSVTFDHDRGLGKTSASLVAKFVAAKMPAGFNSASIRSYLTDRWSLGPQRQTAVLLRAVAAEPPSRISSVDAAEQYWDHAVAGYGASCGINLQPRSHGSEDTGQASQLVDSSVVKQLTDSHKRMASKHYHALAEYLGEDALKLISDAEASSKLIAELQQQLDAWTSEFSTDFLAGIEPRFDANKARHFTSWWNHAREDVMRVYHSQPDPSVLTDPVAQAAFIHHVANRADPALLTLIQTLARQHTPATLPPISPALEQAVSSALTHPPFCRPHLPPTAPHTTITPSGTITTTSLPRPGTLAPNNPAAYPSYLAHLLTLNPPIPPIRIQSLTPPTTNHSHLFLSTLTTLLTAGLSFADKKILLTGAGPNSIGSELLRLLLAGGAHVIATTSRAPSAAAGYFRALYREHAGKGAKLSVVPFNQASAQDCEKLVEYVLAEGGVDAVVPFAAVSQEGVEVDGIGAASEVALRVMMVNVIRLVGAVVRGKRARGQGGVTQVVVPLSPNHGVFGGDGMYPEAKRGLESLLRRVRSEKWGEEMAVCGVEIGWTRETGLMEGNDVVAAAVEREGVLTFSAREMAANIAVVMADEFVEVCEDGPVHADFGGGLRGLENCHEVLARARKEVNLVADIARAIKAEDDRELALLGRAQPPSPVKPLKKRVSLKLGFPPLPQPDADHIIGHFVDPARTVVVVGFSELGPWGSARLRWEMESAGRLSPAGYVEMAWMMGLIKHFDGPHKDNHYVGWVDAKTGDPVEDGEMERKYGEHIKSHSGIRFIEPQAADGYNPSKKEFLQEVAVEDDLPPFETTHAAADAFRLKHGDKVFITRVEGSDNFRVQIKRGATIHVPKASPFPWGSVAGLMPTGFEPSRYGIPQDIIQQVDPVTLYTLCCVAEAFYTAGIPDPMEVFQHIHLSELGNFIGSSMGGALKTRHLYRDAYLDQEIQADTLQDTYLNTTPAWVNMLLLGAAGPIKTPVGACATGLESIDSAMESMLSGKTKMCLVGGYDDFREEESLGFAKMKATVDVAAELARGRIPSEMSRPTASSRAGFVESHGGGVQLLCRGDIALEMGLPIHAVLAGSAMAADKIGRSVPAPGQGILTFARDTDPLRHTPLCTPPPPTHDSLSSDESDYLLTTTPPAARSPPWTPLSVHPAPSRPVPHTLSSSLAAYGLTINDLTFASLHGTSTKANDLNEASVLHTQLTHLGRTPGHPVWAICQKSVTGHPKAPAAAWMLNGCLQVLATGLVPGNRNADDVDGALRKFSHLCYPTETVRLGGEGPNAFLLTSFGFGQKSGQVVGVAARYFFRGLEAGRVKGYRERAGRRQRRAEREFVKAVMEGRVVKVKGKPQWEEGGEVGVYLEGAARVGWDGGRGEYRFE